MAFPVKRIVLFIVYFLTFILPVISIEGNVGGKGSEHPRLEVKETAFDIGVIKRGDEFGYEFMFVNRGRGELKFLKAAGKTPGKTRVKMPSTIPPGKEGSCGSGEPREAE